MTFTAHASAPDYLNPQLPDGLEQRDLTVVNASNDSLKGYGYLVEDRENYIHEITRWPAAGWRPVDSDTGDEAGTTEGIFEFWWQGDILYGRNNAVGGHYILGYGCDPAAASDKQRNETPDQVLLWHANYHPDGGQMFYPLDGTPFMIPLALPGDDVKPDDFVAFYCDGSCGVYIHADIWHEGVFPLRPGKFFDRQGKVHARVSVDFAREFNCLLRVPLVAP